MNDSPRRILIEACVSSLADALQAASLGVDRLEFCSALQVGGLTPRFGDLQQLRSAVAIPIVAMARPRAGDFHYSQSEWDDLLADAKRLLAIGADGIVFGALTKELTVDAARVRELADVVRADPGKELVFHRAFDQASNLDESFAVLRELDVDRILTSGGSASALEGAATIRRLTAISTRMGKPAVLAGGGVRAENAVEILQRTGVRQLHAACTTTQSPTRLEPETLRRLVAVVRQLERSSDHWRSEPEK